MESILLALSIALLIILCLLILRKLGMKAEDTTGYVILQDQVRQQHSLINNLQLKLAEQLATQHNLTSSTLQESSHKHLTELQERMAIVSSRLEDQLKQNITLLQDTTSKHLRDLSLLNSTKLEEIQTTVSKHLDENLKRNLESFAVVKEDLVIMQQSAKKMIDSTASIDRLNAVFASGASKSFGTFSEEMLKSYLDETIPGSFATQYTVPGSLDRIDFCIRFGDQIIGIDSKFPLDAYENYTSSTSETKQAMYTNFVTAIKTMVEDIAKKYVASKHFDQVYIYFPSDSMFLEATANDKLSKLMREKQVFPTSPSNILPMIALVAQYKQRSDITNNAEYILQGMQKIAKHIDAFQNEFRKLGDKLRLAQDNFTSAERSLEGVGREVAQLSSSSNQLV